MKRGNTRRSTKEGCLQVINLWKLNQNNPIAKQACNVVGKFLSGKKKLAESRETLARNNKRCKLEYYESLVL